MNQTLALAGLFQATQLVRETAWQGQVSAPEALQASIASTLKLDADSPADVYGGAERLQLGLKVLLAQISGGPRRDIEVTRYGATLLHLERKLGKRPDLLELIASEIESVKELGLDFEKDAYVLIARIADIYRRSVSTLQPRVMVQGDQGYLSRADLADQIRALLLAGIRSAVLWRQMGGSRLRLVLFRRKTQLAVQAWLKQIELGTD